MNWTLADVEKRNADHPGFHIAPRKVRESLKPGFMAKLVFELNADVSGAAGGERMWVEIKSVTSDGRYMGVLRNNPVVVDAIMGDVIGFGPEHVADFDANQSGDA